MLLEPTVTAAAVPTAMVKLPVNAALPTVAVDEATWPIWLACTPCERLIEIVLPTFAPTWYVVVPLLPLSTLAPLKVVCDAICVTSAICCWTWASSAWRSDALFEPFAASTASVRILCRLLTIVVNAPPAVCASETASLALLIA